MKRVLSIILAFTIAITAVHAEKQAEPQTDSLEVNRFGEVIRSRRVERNINHKKFIFAKEKMYGLSASYNTLDSDNASYLMLLDNVTVSGYITSIKPYVGYFYRDNRAIGARFGYTAYGGEIDAASLDFGETNDLSFDISYVDLKSRNYSYAIFHRAYAALDDAGHFGLFAEVEMSASMGTTTLIYDMDGERKTTESKNRSFDLSFNPGVSAFILPNVCASLSFEFGGLNYTRIEQYDAEGVHTGTRESSKMKFKFNVLAISFGITAHIW